MPDKPYLQGVPGGWNKAEMKDYLNIQQQINNLDKIHVEARIRAYDLQLAIDEKIAKELDTLKKINDLGGANRKCLEEELVAQKQKIDLAEKYGKNLKSDLVMARNSLGTWDRLKVSAGGFGNVFKKFDYTTMEGSWKNSMYIWKTIGEEMGGVGLRGAILLEIAKQTFKTFQSWDAVLSKFRQGFGMFREPIGWFSKNTKNITEDMMDIAKSLARIGVDVGTVVGSFESISSLVGGIWNVSKELVKTLSAMSVSLGVTQDVSTGALRNMALMSGTTMEAQTNSLLFAQALSNAAGVSFSAVATDIGKMSDTALLFTRKGVPGLIRAAVELRKMGTSFTDAAHAASSLLEFGSSINSEMEASVLLGRSMNLQRARELAYAGDLEGSTKELLRTAKSVNFTGLDYFQKGGVAKAMGLTVDQVYNMLQVDKEREVILRSQDKTVQAMNAEYNRLRNSSEKTRQSEAERVKLSLMNKVNLSRTASIASSWNQIVSKLAYFFLPVIDKSLAAINWLVSKVADNLLISTSIGAALWAGVKKGWISFRAIGDVIKALGEEIFFVAMKKNWVWLETVGSWVNKIGMRISSWTVGLGKVAGKLKGLIELLPFVGKFITRVSAGLSGLFGGLVSRIGFLFKKILGPIGAIWAAFDIGWWIGKQLNKIQFISNAVTRYFVFVMDTWRDVKGAVIDLWKSIVPAVMSSISLIVMQFEMVGGKLWNTVKDWANAIWSGMRDFVGFSPSRLGLSIVNGLISVGPLMLKALMSPFEALLRYISSVPILGGLMSKMGIDVGPKNVESKATAAYIPAVTVSPTGTKIESRKEEKPGEKPKAESSGTTLDDLIAVNKEMLSAMKSLLAKDPSVKLDGQLVSTYLARGQEFRGGFGSNHLT
jgi:hypothetical protein